MKSDLPRGWMRAKLGDVVSTPRKRIKPTSRPGMPFVGMADIEAHTMRLVDTSPAESMRSAAAHFFPGDVLYGRLRPYLNKVHVAEFEGLCSAEFIPIVCPAEVEAKFIGYLINSADFVAFASHLDEGDRPRVDFQQVSAFALSVPPLPEQRRIIAAIESHLSRVDAALAALHRVQRNLARYRASVLHAAVTGRLVPTEAELARAEGREYEPASVLLTRILAERRRRWEEAELAKMVAAGKAPKDDRWKGRYVEPVGVEAEGLGELPDGWCWTTVDCVGDVLLGRQRAPQFLTGRFPHPYLRVANVKDDRLDFADVDTMDFDENHFAKYRLEAGDILVSEGQSPELVGQSALYQGELPHVCFQKTLHRFRPISHGPSARYCQLVFRSHVRTGVFRSVASITTNIAHLTLEKFKAAPFPLAPAAEQDRIEGEAQRILSTTDTIELQIGVTRTRLTRLRQSILRLAFEGRLVDQDPNDEPASVLLDRIKAERAVGVGAVRQRRRKANAVQERLL